MKTKNKEKTLKATREVKTHYKVEEKIKNIHDIRFLIRKKEEPDKNGEKK